MLLNGRGALSTFGTNWAVGGERSKPLPILVSDDLNFSATKSTILLIRLSSLLPVPKSVLVSSFLRLISGILELISVETESSESDFAISSPVPEISEIQFYNNLQLLIIQYVINL